MSSNEEHQRILQAVFEAFNRHDAEAVVSHMSEDIVFNTVGGDEAYGTRIVGRAAVKAAFENVWKQSPDVQWRNHKHFACGEYGVSQWTFVAPQADGSRIEADGIDLFRFRDGVIIEKHAFRKNRPPVK